MEIRQVGPDSTNWYIESWQYCMTGVPWFSENIPFHYNRAEEMKEIEHDLSTGEGLFLAVMESSYNSELALGVLGVKLREKSAHLRPWEPTVFVSARSQDVGEMLLEKAFVLLEASGIEQVSATLKYVYGGHASARYLTSLFKKMGMRESRRTVQLLCDLSTKNPSPQPDLPIEIVTGDKYTLEDFSNFTIRAFASTEADRIIHADDRSVQDYAQSLLTHKRIRNGVFGFSPTECWRVALVDGEVAGFAICFIPSPTSFRPPHGVLGELGVMPKFRRHGIGKALIAETHRIMRSHNCQYSYVGTPEQNLAALRLYESCGYRRVFHVIFFTRSLRV